MASRSGRRTFGLWPATQRCAGLKECTRNLHAHRAADDVFALREVFRRCIEVLAPATARDLQEVRVAERKAREAVLTACEEALAAKAPVKITYRPSRKPAQTFTLIVSEVRRSDAHVVGYLLPSRSRRELRAERILRVDAVEAT